MKRTQQEIMARFDVVEDFMGIQKGDLGYYLEFENIKHAFKSDYVAQVESGEEKWEVATDPKKEIIDYLPFAFEKAYGERGLSAGRSMLHFKSWIWLDDPEFYEEIVDDLDNYHSYGLPALNRIAKKYGVEVMA